MLIGLHCEPRQELRLLQTLMKRCRHCGHNNDLCTALSKIPVGQCVMPLCFICGKPLWKTMKPVLRLVDQVILSAS